MRSSSMRSENSAPAAAAAAPPPSYAKDMSLGQSNVFKLLARRELSPQTKKTPKRFWVKVTGDQVDSCCLKSEIAKDARQELRSWAEAESLLHLSAKYCPLQPPPRSTIAAAFSPDGKTLASTHGDHTVKIIDCQTGTCLKVLTGHRRTPWVVRFHPLYPEVVASGSLDHEVRLWDAKTAACIGSRDFYRPIASIAFHAQGEFLAVASGHKLYIWYYSRRGEASSPMIILRTRRSLRAVHFHPHGAPLLLTAEVNDLNSSDPTMTIATCAGYSRYPPPTIYVADPNPPYHSNSGNESPFVSMPFLIFPSVGRGESGPTSQQQDIQPQRADSSTSVRLLTYSTPSGQYELVLSPIQSPAREEPQNNINNDDSNNNTNNSSLHRETDNSSTYQPSANVSTEIDRQAEEAANQFFPFGDPTHWELPFLQGWLIGQSQVGQQAAEDLSSYGAVGGPSPVLPPEVPHGSSIPGVSGRSGLRQWISQSHTRLAATTGGNPGSAAAFGSIPVEQGSARAFVGPAQPEAAAELPCTVKLRIWSHDVKNPCVALDADKCRLTIPHVVLCSEMGAHFSPCGRFLAACVACIQINTDTDPGLQGQVQHEFMGASTSPTRHPIAVHPVIYELRIYSLEEATFGSVLASRAIRAAHCLTSIQFSPTSEHLLLAYGRRHNSLLKSVVIDGDTTVSIYTILEIYRVSDMELVRVLPSAEDEVNVASFHPSVGGGFIYGTKEGKLRILQCDSSHGLNNDGSRDLGNNMPEVQRYASES